MKREWTEHYERVRRLKGEGEMERGRNSEQANGSKKTTMETWLHKWPLPGFSAHDTCVRSPLEVL